jgi:hypothetical protein
LLFPSVTRKQKYFIGVGSILGFLLVLLWMTSNQSAPPISELAKTTSNNDHYLSSKVIPETDLPPEGTRSLFDHLIVQNGGIVPYPYSKLIEMLKELNPEGTEPISLLIPNGRSLLKGQADNAHPRIVTTADFEIPNTGANLSFAPRGQLFLGFVENGSEIEVVSYNEAAGRFEFQLVQDYCQDCSPRIVYARRAVCSTCHQGGTPIFSQRPWNETNGQPATAAAITAGRGSSDPYQTVPIQQPLSFSERFDQLTDVGNFFYASQRLWLDGCGETGNECRRQMLSLAFQYLDNAGSFNPNSPEANELRRLQELAFKNSDIPKRENKDEKYTPVPMGLQGTPSPQKGIVVPESDLANRDPIGEKQGFKGWIRSLFTRDIKFGEGARDNEDLSSFEKLPPLRKEFDPLTIRPPKQILGPKDIDGVYGLASFFTESDFKKIGEQNGYDIKRIVAKVKSLPNEVFDPKPFSRVLILQALLGKKQYCCYNTAEMSPPMVSGGPPLEIKKHPELQAFADNCFSCHRGNPAKRLNFMGGANEDEVLEQIKAKKEIRDALDWERYEGTDKSSKLMPPRNSAQYRKLKDAGEEGKKILLQMRETVPGFFNF